MMDQSHRRASSVYMYRRRRSSNQRDEDLVKRVALTVIGVSGILFLIVAIVYSALGKEIDSQILFYSVFVVLEVIVLCAGFGPKLWAWCVSMCSDPSSVPPTMRQGMHVHVHSVSKPHPRPPHPKQPVFVSRQKAKSKSSGTLTPPRLRTSNESNKSKSAHQLKSDSSSSEPKVNPQPEQASLKMSVVELAGICNARGDYLPDFKVVDITDQDSSNYENDLTCNPQKVKPKVVDSLCVVISKTV